MDSLLFFVGILVVVFLMSAMALHRYDLNRPLEIIFFGITAALVLYYQHLLHK